MESGQEKTSDQDTGVISVKGEKEGRAGQEEPQTAHLR